jgi:leader peptidase (prepilin peptidase) / N-methyltransferase
MEWDPSSAGWAAALAGPAGIGWSVGLAWAVVCAVVLFVTDLREHRLPNRWTGALAVGGVLTAAAVALLSGSSSVLVTALLCGAGYLAAMLVLHLVTRGGLGMGDVKLAGGLGLYTGVLGPAATFAAGLLAVLVGGLVAAVLVLVRRAHGSTALPFGPPMLVAAAAVLASSFL